MMPFDYKYQNPSGFACLMPVRAIVIVTPLGIQNLDKIRRKKLDCAICSQMMPCDFKLPIVDLTLFPNCNPKFQSFIAIVCPLFLH